MTNIFSSLPELTEHGKEIEAEAARPDGFTRMLVVAERVGQALGESLLPEATLGSLAEITATQPELARELARFVADNVTGEAAQRMALETGVKAARLIAAQMRAANETQ